MPEPSPATLVFPADMPEGLAYRERVRSSGVRVVGASSVEASSARGAYDYWEHLPYVSTVGFDAALGELVRRQSVNTIYTPHYVVLQHLSTRLQTIAPGTQLCGGPTPRDIHSSYRILESRMGPPRDMPGHNGANAQPALSAIERLGLIRLVNTIPGMCSEEKMSGVMDVLRFAPPGDVVEIGSWWGRSAALLVCLARRYGIGPVLCIDPWSRATMAQGDPLLDAAGLDLDPDEAFRIFETNLSPLAIGDLNVLRLRSEEAAAVYVPGVEVVTTTFGATRYSGGISVLHIDGNHAFEEVERDIAAWVPFVVPNGWVIFDDYEWAFGTGPMRATDAFLARNASRVMHRFRAGPALVVQLGCGFHA